MQRLILIETDCKYLFFMSGFIDFVFKVDLISATKILHSDSPWKIYCFYFQILIGGQIFVFIIILLTS